MITDKLALSLTLRKNNAHLSKGNYAADSATWYIDTNSNIWMMKDFHEYKSQSIFKSWMLQFLRKTFLIYGIKLKQYGDGNFCSICKDKSSIGCIWWDFGYVVAYLCNMWKAVLNIVKENIFYDDMTTSFYVQKFVIHCEYFDSTRARTQHTMHWHV